MGKSMDRQDYNCEETKYEESYMAISPNVSPTSPLDLSIKSRRFPFPQSPTSPLDLSTKHILNIHRQMSVEAVYQPPEIIIQPKSEWHYRSVKDLASNHLPFVAGDGPQRTPIRVTVPETTNVQMYLGMAIITVDNEPHPSKVIVPARTRVDPERFAHDNNLDCLRFDENSVDHFDSVSRCIYSKISLMEHRTQCKDVRIRMFNLYQNHVITKEMIEDKQLNRCRLSFWLCIHQNGMYMSVSRPSYSIIIEEKKMTSRPRISHIIGSPNPYPVSYIEYTNQENTDDDGSY